MDKEKELQFWRDLRHAKDLFIQSVAEICRAYGVDIVPLSYDEIDKFLNFRLDRLLDPGFRRVIERKVKRHKRELNPVWRRIRKFFGR